jgi:hypothetical protein
MEERFHVHFQSQKRCEHSKNMGVCSFDVKKGEPVYSRLVLRELKPLFDYIFRLTCECPHILKT